MFKRFRSRSDKSDRGVEDEPVPDLPPRPNQDAEYFQEPLTPTTTPVENGDHGDDDGTESPTTRRAKYTALLKESMIKNALKGKLALEHAVGLGAKPNVIPPEEPSINGMPRKVHIAWHPVGGAAGKWFAEQTVVGKWITEKVDKYPDPSQHWGILCGEYAHQLWMDENLDVIYFNERVTDQQWTTFEVGHTTFNDEALRQAAEMTIYNMRHKRPAYNLISNNCQNFALNLLDAIQIGKHREFGSTFAIYKRATGKGSIKDLFAQEPMPDPVPLHAVGDVPKPPNQSTVQYAAQVMDENTTKLDTHDSFR